MKNTMVFLFGIPGAGKSTIGELIKHKYKFSLINVGHLLKKKLKTSFFAIDEKEIITKSISFGNPIPIEILEKVIKNETGKNLNINGFIFDGFPRNSVQFDNIGKILNNIGLFSYVLIGIHLKCKESVAIERIRNRVYCENCGFSFRKKVDFCTNCKKNEFLSRRSDDVKLETVKNRFLQFNKNMLPLLLEFKVKYSLYEINAETSTRKSMDAISKLLDQIN